jgi:hypothetical protein
MALCMPCSTIDLSILSDHALLRSHQHGIRLGNFHHADQPSVGDCPLCRLVKALSSHYSIKDSSPFGLFACAAWKSSDPLPIPKKVRNLKRAEVAVFEDINIAILAIEASDEPWNPFKNPYIALFPPAFTKMEVYLPTMNSMPDFKTICKWIDRCASQHTDERFHSQLRGLEPWKTTELYRVIDCEIREIVCGRPSCAYVTLSYVWGYKSQGMFQSKKVVLWQKKANCRVEHRITSCIRISPTLLKMPWTSCASLDYGIFGLTGKKAPFNYDKSIYR